MTETANIVASRKAPDAARYALDETTLGMKSLEGARALRGLDSVLREQSSDFERFSCDDECL